MSISKIFRPDPVSIILLGGLVLSAPTTAATASGRLLGLPATTAQSSPAPAEEDQTAPKEPSPAGPEQDQEQEPGVDAWSGSAGVSLLATDGNSSTTSVGAELKLQREPDPWGLESGASFSWVDQDGETTTESYRAFLRGERNVSDRWSLLAGVTAERDQLAGYELRSIVALGARVSVVQGGSHSLEVDGGLTWTNEDLVRGPTESSTGAVTGLSYTWKISETASLSERAELYPSFSDSDDWRLASETALTADLNKTMALKLSYRLSYDHQPVPGFETTDTTTTASIVFSF